MNNPLHYNLFIKSNNMDLQNFLRDFKEQPFTLPVLNLYNKFMGIKRYDHMPFYFYPQAKSWISFEDTIITFVDWLIDAHEDARNTADRNRSFYQRSVYFYQNFFRWTNETLANCMYDDQLRKADYDRLNSVLTQRMALYGVSMTALHTTGFMYLAYFFRYRRVTLLPCFLISCAYYYFFDQSLLIAYKLIVDNNVNATARKLGLDKHVQPFGHFKNRGINFI